MEGVDDFPQIPKKPTDREGGGITRCVRALAYDGGGMTALGSLGRRQQLQTAGIRRLHGRRDLPEAVFGELLAIAQPVHVDRRETADPRPGLAEADHLPEMGHQSEVAEPSEKRRPREAA